MTYRKSVTKLHGTQKPLGVGVGSWIEESGASQSVLERERDRERERERERERDRQRQSEREKR